MGHHEMPWDFATGNIIFFFFKPNLYVVQIHSQVFKTKQNNTGMFFQSSHIVNSRDPPLG